MLRHTLMHTGALRYLYDPDSKIAYTWRVYFDDLPGSVAHYTLTQIDPAYQDDPRDHARLAGVTLSHAAASAGWARQAISEPARRRQGALRASPPGTLGTLRAADPAACVYPTSQEPVREAPITVLSGAPDRNALTHPMRAEMRAERGAAMSSMTGEIGVVVGGVDTHSQTHHVAVIDQLGREVSDREFPATAVGYAAL
jgi:hypothetical protein